MRIENKLREEGHHTLKDSDQRFKRRDEDREVKKRKFAGDNPEDIARGGVILEDAPMENMENQRSEQIEIQDENSMGCLISTMWIKTCRSKSWI